MVGIISDVTVILLFITSHMFKPKEIQILYIFFSIFRIVCYLLLIIAEIPKKNCSILIIVNSIMNTVSDFIMYRIPRELIEL